MTVLIGQFQATAKNGLNVSISITQNKAYLAYPEAYGVDAGGQFADTGIGRGYAISGYSASLSSTDSETRPSNFTYKIWVRTA